MKTLHLLRHAKAVEGDMGGSDHLRPLAKRGIKACGDMAAYITENKVKVERVFCSPSKRTRETYELVARALGDATVVYRDRLYLISMSDLIDFIQGLPDTDEAIMLIGHNPGFHTAAVALTKGAARGQTAAFTALKEKFPTATLCSITFDVEHWKQVRRGGGTLAAFVAPRDLED